ncbi:6-pyruvoyl tetrahydropterin synthase family protein [Streptomyces sp. NPDC056632]|uniref:6-pyruvoyl trahydropterin synthase family protein n=1 Tax=Streptomyces sp. NPDC056632 TaxID=3345884 RepID=UPI0036D169FD
MPGPQPRPMALVMGLLNGQHYGDATYMTMRELFDTFPEGAFEAGHRLPGPPPERRCFRRHGHTYEVEVTLTVLALQGCLDS